MTALRYARVGHMDIERWMAFWFEIGARVFCNGNDITPICRWFDDREGKAECLALDDNGEPYVDGDHVAVVEVHGDVKVRIP